MRAFMDRFDEDGNGAIELEEFKGMLDKVEVVELEPPRKQQGKKQKEEVRKGKPRKGKPK